MMRILVTLVACVLIAAVVCPAANAYTITFDDMQPGSEVWTSDYAFSFGFHVAAADSVAWVMPHSSPNVLVWVAGPQWDQYAKVGFGYYDSTGGIPAPVTCVAAYFCTSLDTVVRMTATGNDGTTSSVLIGETGQAWTNRYVQIDLGGKSFHGLRFYGVSGSGLQGFSIDDMNVTPVPEPSSLLALLTGLAGLGAALRRQSRG